MYTHMYINIIHAHIHINDIWIRMYKNTSTNISDICIHMCIYDIHTHMYIYPNIRMYINITWTSA